MVDMKVCIKDVIFAAKSEKTKLFERNCWFLCNRRWLDRLYRLTWTESIVGFLKTWKIWPRTPVFEALENESLDESLFRLVPGHDFQIVFENCNFRSKIVIKTSLVVNV